MLPWRRKTITTQLVIEHFHIDTNSAKRWFKETFGHAPARYGGWDSKATALLARVLKKNRAAKSTVEVASMFHVHRSVIEKTWAAAGFVLPPRKRLIGCWYGRPWTASDIGRLRRWLRVRYRVGVNAALGVPVKKCGRRPEPSFFEDLARTA